MEFMLTYHHIHHPDSTLLIQETNQYVMKVLTNMDNNTTDDLQFTLTIKGYSQNATAKLDVDPIITDLEEINRLPTTG